MTRSSYALKALLAPARPSRASPSQPSAADACSECAGGGDPAGRLVVTVAVAGPLRTMLDVIAAPSTSLVGPPEAVAAVLASAVAELAPALARAGGRLVVVGGAPNVGPPEEATTAPGVVAEVATCEVAEAFVERLDARWPAVVVVTPPVTLAGAPQLSRLVARASRRRATGVLLGGPSPLAAHAVRVGATASQAGDAPMRGPIAVVSDASQGADTRAARVDVLGPVMVSGGGHHLDHHPKLTELAVYLSLHANGVPGRVWAEALWPDRAVAPQTVANRLSELRRLLGFAPDGRPRLRRDGERHLIVDVASDWATFKALGTASGEPATWRRALELVRGRPFAGLREEGWTRVEGHEAEIEQTVTACALRLSAALLEDGDPQGATWAAHQGLRAVPWDERLHRALMRAGDAAGDLGQVEATLRHLAIVLDIEGDPLGSVHPETARLYAQLSGRRLPVAR